MGKSSRPTIDVQGLSDRARKTPGLLSYPYNFLPIFGAPSINSKADHDTIEVRRLTGVRLGEELITRSRMAEIFQISQLERQFDAAVEALTTASDQLQTTMTNSALAIAKISAAGDRIDRLNAENAEALKHLLEGV